MATVRDPGVEPAVRRPGHLSLQFGRVGLRINLRVLGIALAVAAAVLLLGLWAMTLGAMEISVPEVFAATFGFGTPQHEFLIRDFRLPRVLAAVVVGAAFAMSGAIFQGLVRNELASPDIIGINAGAGMVGYGWLMLTQNVTALPYALFLGAMGMATVIYLLSWQGGISKNRLILVGIGVATFLSAIQAFLVRRFPIDDTIWAQNLLLGSIANATWAEVSFVAVAMAILVPAALLLAWPLRALQLGDDVARAVGWPVELVRFALLFVGAWLCAIAISVAGLVGFLALMVPHAARAIAGPMSASVMVLTGVLGAFVLLGSDVIAHHFLPVDLPVDVVMGALGAPYFLLLFWIKGARI